MRKTIRFIDGLVNRIVALLCLLLFLICLYATIDAVNVYLNANDTGILKYKPQLSENAEQLKEISDDVVAWLSLDDTGIDYPVMQGKTNVVYLNKNPYGEFSLSGSIFLDSRNSSDFSDPYSLVYGHHMEYGAMFGALDEYCKQDFFEQHSKGTLITASGKSYSIDVFASLKADAKEKLIFDPTETAASKTLEYIKNHALIYKEIKKSDAHIIALSTCQSAENTERMIVFGTLEPID